MYDLTDDLGIGLRAEWFRDNNGFRIAGPGRCGASYNLRVPGDASTGYQYACQGQGSSYPWAGASYYAFTLGANYKPLKWVMVRPNVRYDFSSQDTFMTSTPGEMVDYQFTFSTDVVITF